MLLTRLLSAGGGGGDPDVTGLASTGGYGLPGHHPQANSIATIMLCIGCLLAGLAADRFNASHVHRRSLLLALSS